MEPTIESRVGVLEATVAGVQRELNTDVAEIKQDLKELRTMLADRPSWAVTRVIAALSFSTAASISTLLTILAQHGG